MKRVARHKYEQGVVHVVAGSEGLTGAAITACRSAWQNGASAVFLYAPKKLLPIYETILPEIIKIPLGDDSDSHYKESHAEKITEQLESKPGTLLAGPGVGTRPDTQKCLLSIFQSYLGKAIIDADALSLWKELKSMAETEQNDWLFTPHIGESTKYMGSNFSTDIGRLNWAAEISNKHKCSIIMKGTPTFLTTPKNGRFITAYNTNMFSKAGFGDQLSGAIAAQTAIRDNSTFAALYSLYSSYMGYRNHNHDRAFTPQSLL
jgi:NAD(P)H-hydrate epimerase